MTAQPDPVALWFASRRAEILGAWRRLLFARMAGECVPHLQNSDPFANPFGHRIHTVTEGVVDGLATGAAAGALGPVIEPLIRVQAIQGGRASEAVAFVPLLLEAAGQVPGGLHPLHEGVLRGRLDALLLVAFDVYTRCREELHEIRVREARRRVSALLDRIGAGDEVDDGRIGSEGRGPR